MKIHDFLTNFWDVQNVGFLAKKTSNDFHVFVSFSLGFSLFWTTEAVYNFWFFFDGFSSLKHQKLYTQARVDPS